MAENSVVASTNGWSSSSWSGGGWASANSSPTSWSGGGWATTGNADANGNSSWTSEKDSAAVNGNGANEVHTAATSSASNSGNSWGASWGSSWGAKETTPSTSWSSGGWGSRCSWNRSGPNGYAKPWPTKLNQTHQLAPAKEQRPPPRPWKGPRPRPDPRVCDKLLEQLKASKDKVERSRLYPDAIRTCAAVDRAEEALDLVGDMGEEGMDPDLAVYSAALEACETIHQQEGKQLARAKMMLDEMRSQSLDFSATCEGYTPRRTPEGLVDGLQHHAQLWMTRIGGKSMDQEALGFAAEITSALRCQGALDPIVESSFREAVLKPTVETLRRPSAAAQADLERINCSPSLGLFSRDMLEDLHVDCRGRAWQDLARSLVRHQLRLRRWAAWTEPRGPAGLVAWIAYDVSGGDGASKWEISCNGEAFGLDPHRPASPTPLLVDSKSARNQGPAHGEQRALIALTDAILQKLQGTPGGVRVEGVVQLYGLRAPSIATLLAIARFLEMFPWVRISFGYGGASLKPQEPLVLTPTPKPETMQERWSSNASGWASSANWQSKSGSGWYTSEASGTGASDGNCQNGYYNSGYYQNGQSTYSNGNDNGSWNRWV